MAEGATFVGIVLTGENDCLYPSWNFGCPRVGMCRANFPVSFLPVVLSPRGLVVCLRVWAFCVFGVWHSKTW